MSYCKLDLSILDNPGYGLLPDNLWRKLIELFILACEFDRNGELPRIETIGWYLHNTRNIESLRSDIDQLIDRKLLAIKGDDGSTLVVRNFDQISMATSTDRVRRYRARKAANGCTGFDAEAIKRRDNNDCIYCGSADDLCVDHIYPIILGGTDDYNNLACACKTCNSSKGGKTPSQAGMTFKNKVAEERYQVYLEDGL